MASEVTSTMGQLRSGKTDQARFERCVAAGVTAADRVAGNSEKAPEQLLYELLVVNVQPVGGLTI